MHVTSTLIQNNQTNLGVWNILLHNSHEQIKNTNQPKTSCTPMRTPLLTKKLSNLQVSLQAINSSPLYEAFMVSKAFQISLLNKCHHSSKHLLNKVLLLYILMLFCSYQTLKNTCSNLLNNYILLAQKYP